MGMKIKQLKQSVQSQTGVQAKDFKLSFDGVELTDDELCLQGTIREACANKMLIWIAYRLQNRHGPDTHDG
jgi:hypothetical protein